MLQLESEYKILKGKLIESTSEELKEKQQSKEMKNMLPKFLEIGGKSYLNYEITAGASGKVDVRIKRSSKAG